MKIEEQLTNLELSKKLKELGVKQESCFFWGFVGASPIKIICYPLINEKVHKKYNAFSSSDISAILPEFVVVKDKEYYVGTYKLENRYFCRYAKPIDDGEIAFPETTADTEVGARAKMLIYLIENKLIDLRGTTPSK